MLLRQVLLQLHVLHLHLFQVILLPLKLTHLHLVALLGICKFDSLGLDEAIDSVILLQLNDPVAEALGGFGRVRDNRRFEVGLVKELILHFRDNVLRNIVLIIILQLGKEVFFTHELLCSVPPIILKLLGVLLLWRSFDFTIAHDADGMQNHFNIVRWSVQHLDLVDV